MDARTRFITRSAVLLAAVAALLIGLIGWQVARDGARSADRNLDALGQTQRLVEVNADRDLATRGELIAGNQAVVAYMTQSLGSALPGQAIDSSSIVDLLEERRKQLGLDVAALVNADGRQLATTEHAADAHDFATDPVFLAARKAQATRTGLWQQGGRLLHIAILPLARYGSGDAYLLVGDLVGQDFVQAIAGIGAADVALAVPSATGPLVTASTLVGADAAALPNALRIETGAADHRQRLSLPSRTLKARSAPLFGNPKASVIVMARDLPLRAVVAAQLPAIVFALVIVFGIAIALGWYWRRIAEPLYALEQVMRRAAETGDNHLHVDEQGAPAVARVSAGFNRLMVALRAPAH